MSNSNPDNVTKFLKPIYFLNMEVKSFRTPRIHKSFPKIHLCFICVYIYIMYMFVNKFFKIIER